MHQQKRFFSKRKIYVEFFSFYRIPQLCPSPLHTANATDTWDPLLPLRISKYATASYGETCLMDFGHYRTSHTVGARLDGAGNARSVDSSTCEPPTFPHLSAANHAAQRRNVTVKKLAVMFTLRRYTCLRQRSHCLPPA